MQLCLFVLSWLVCYSLVFDLLLACFLLLRYLVQLTDCLFLRPRITKTVCAGAGELSRGQRSLRAELRREEAGPFARV